MWCPSHIDTVERYGCESILGEVIQESDMKCEDLWVTTKLWLSDYGLANTTVLLFYLHIYHSITVSNFLINHLEQFMEDCDHVEFHPLQRPQKLPAYCQKRNIVFESYCPLAGGKVSSRTNVLQLV
ncbi:9,11-endoperoxide prostaglandin H2 reductase-like [Dugong dugon]